MTNLSKNYLIIITAFAVVVIVVVFLYSIFVGVTRKPTLPTLNGLTGLDSEEASRIGAGDTLSLTTSVVTDGILLQWTDRGESSRGSYTYYNYYNVYRQIGFSDNWKLIGRVKVKPDNSGAYEYVDREVIAGTKYVYKIVAALISGKYQEEHGTSNISELISP